MHRLLMDQVLPVPVVDSGDVRRAADEILSGPEYRSDESLLDRVLRVLDDALAGVLGQLTAGGAGALVAIVLLAVFAAVVGNLLWRWRGWGTGPRRGDGVASLVVSARVGGEPRRSAGAWRDEADRAAASLDFDAAIRARYRALLAELVASGTIDDMAGTTSGAYSRRLSAAQWPWAAEFAAATTLFEHAWFGPAMATLQDLEQFVAAEAKIVIGASA